MAYAVASGHRYISVDGYNIYQYSGDRNLSCESPDIALCTLCVYLLPFASLSVRSEIRQKNWTKRIYPGPHRCSLNNFPCVYYRRY